MLLPHSDQAVGVAEPPGDFTSNYSYLKELINKALKEGVPLESLHLVQKRDDSKTPKRLSRGDLIKLLHSIRRIRTRYQRLLECPVPKELERDILAKPEEDRLPWEEEALDRIDQWRKDVASVRNKVRAELNEHLKRELFQEV